MPFGMYRRQIVDVVCALIPGGCTWIAVGLYRKLPEDSSIDKLCGYSLQIPGRPESGLLSKRSRPNFLEGRFSGQIRFTWSKAPLGKPWATSVEADT